MKKFIAICCTVFLFSTAVFSQEQDEDDDRFAVEYRMNEPGDQFINIGLMVTFPLNFGGDFPLYREGQLSTGGAGTIGYHRFLTSWFAVGLDVSFGKDGISSVSQSGGPMVSGSGSLPSGGIKENRGKGRGKMIGRVSHNDGKHRS